MSHDQPQSLLVIDFGGQTAHLISRRIKELGATAKLVEPEEVLAEVKKNSPQGLILSGGPDSVYLKNAPTITPEIFNLNVPILGICYGLQLTAQILGGVVKPGKKEYGPAKLELVNGYQLEGFPKKSTVWMSHGDEVISLPKDFQVIGSTDHVVNALVINHKQKVWGVQFHPEVEHTQYGMAVLKAFIKECRITLKKESLDLAQIIKQIKSEVRDSFVIGAVSGGVDSTVAGVLTAKAISEKFIPIYVDNGLMREGTTEHVQKIFASHNVRPIIIKAEKKMLKRLKGVVNPEKKRKIIGNFYIELFESEMRKLVKEGKDVKYLLQGTIYSDVIESKGSKYASKIKSHHNVGGLPKKMKLKLLEPLRHLYKDEVRLLGKRLGISDEFVQKQPFPGPGFAVRIRGEITAKRLALEKQSDAIVLEELKKANLLSKVFLSFPVMTGSFSTAVKGDGRFFGEVIALRVIESKDIMTSIWAHLPYEVLQKISSRIVNEVPGISRVVYDITTKPPATMEWE